MEKIPHDDESLKNIPEAEKVDISTSPVTQEEMNEAVLVLKETGDLEGVVNKMPEEPLETGDATISKEVLAESVGDLGMGDLPKDIPMDKEMTHKEAAELIGNNSIKEVDTEVEVEEDSKKKNEIPTKKDDELMRVAPEGEEEIRLQEEREKDNARMEEVRLELEKENNGSTESSGGLVPPHLRRGEVVGADGERGRGGPRLAATYESRATYKKCEKCKGLGRNFGYVSFIPFIGKIFDQCSVCGGKGEVISGRKEKRTAYHYDNVQGSDGARGAMEAVGVVNEIEDGGDLEENAPALRQQLEKLGFKKKDYDMLTEAEMKTILYAHKDPRRKVVAEIVPPPSN